MNIHAIDITNFMNHVGTSVELPDEGVVVLTGANGSGKSAITEAVCWSAFKKTIRKASPTPPDATPFVRLTTDELVIERSGKTGNTLKWWFLDEDPVAWETSTKAQLALEDANTDMTTWLRTHFFSPPTAGFGMATDSERKRLLERMLGLVHYETAYRECLGDLSQATKTSTRLDRDLEVIEVELEGLEDRIVDAEVVLEENSESDPLVLPDLSSVKQDLDERRKERHRIKESLKSMRTDLMHASALLKSAEREYLRLAKDSCPTCGQDIPEPLRDRLAATVAKTRAEATQQEAQLAAEEDDVSDQLQELEEEIAEAQTELGALTQKKAAQAAVERHRMKAERALAVLKQKNEEIEDRLADIADELEEAQHKTDVLKASGDALGVKGYRAHVLSEALRGLEGAANSVLDHLTVGKIRIKLSSYSTSKKGSVSDSISLTVKIGDSVQDYRSCSTGQRRRVDVAMVLALARLSGAGGTLWFDEVFDGLDTDGVDRLTELLSTLAVGRAVVVITHSRELAKKIQARERWHVTAGELR